MHHSLVFLHNRRHHPGESDPKRWPLSIVSVPSCLQGGPQNCAIARNCAVKVNIFMTLCTTLLFSYTIIGTTKASEIPRDGLSSSSLCRVDYLGPSKLCNSEELVRPCGLYYYHYE